ncbi:hypothetical protein PV11_04456 [Exophiala sideris]|uniref:Mitochondrial inner membrane protease ATP23 n=1 Tax=Exophiala sideris TaxID=1016849 RepID=A0A0D1YHK0_9EURO|nr:hypothetical protein PV11_04456 [Exophiala sideris]
MADSEESSAPSQGGSDLLPSNTFWNRCKNFSRMAFGTMSPEGAKAYWSDADRRFAKIDCKRCEDQRDYLLKFSPIIRYMKDNIQKVGGDIGSHNIRCRSCTAEMQGGFDHEYGIVLCANRLEQRSQVEDVMAHEMVHCYDILRFKTDLGPDADLRHSACSEIRASNLSGECRWANEFFRNHIPAFTNHHQDCVRRRAIASIKNRPNCKDDVHAVKIVNEVWDSCFRDTRPFDEIYR